jgi:predicted O-methyltransferase YrrM
MSPEELVRLHELVVESRAKEVLEVGMGSGTSTLVILTALAQTQGARLTSIDPFQTEYFKRDGVTRIRNAGLADRHELVERPDYLALPQMLADGSRFDFILVDGYHSFDYTLVDVFYADLLLRPGGILTVHDSSWPAVLKVLRFVETHKKYERLSPTAYVKRDDFVSKALRRIGIYLSGPERVRDFNQRRLRWHTLAAYRKTADSMAPEYDLGF